MGLAQAEAQAQVKANDEIAPPAALRNQEALAEQARVQVPGNAVPIRFG
jgi:hypothetical protein